MIKKAVILCGGLATRFLPISKSVPKEMLPLLDKPILQVLVEDLKKAGITDVLILIGRGKECIIRHFDHNIELENRLIESGKTEFLKLATEPNTLANIYYKMQDKPLGTGHCLKLAQAFVGDDPFVMLFGDELMTCENKNIVEQLIDNYNTYHKSVIAVQECDPKEVYRYGIIKNKPLGNGASLILNFVEKPKVEEAPSNICNLGTAILTSDVFKYIDQCKIKNGELSVTDAYNLMIEKELLMAQDINGRRYDMGNKLGFVIANIDACLKDPTYGEDLRKYLKSLDL